ncbi:DUF3899 domain-containing protein [Bacillus cihuensis]|uniref:DUF3899 domain-containing protein n=1 Tax=Bacillus cihuensis TaxID=1208599 RepID=UPI000414C781|nr:DUF3899 domain-containing protein [Bacillus cihuensis]
MKKTMIWTGAMVLLSLILSLVFYHEITLRSFLDMIFYIAGLLLTFSLFTFVLQKGFFDVIHYSFRKVLPSKSTETEEKSEIRKLSELITFNLSVPFSTGFTLLLILIIGLYVYYL